MQPVKVEIVDAEAAEKALAEMSDELRYKAVRSALRAAAKPVAAAMVARAPADTGDLRASINILTLRERQAERVGGTLSELRRTDPKLVAVIVGPNKKVGGNSSRASIAHIVEFGAKPHRIKGRRLRIGGDDVVSGDVDHPGIKPRPFMGPALEGTESAQQAAFFQGLSRHLTNLARRQARR